MSYLISLSPPHLKNTAHVWSFKQFGPFKHLNIYVMQRNAETCREMQRNSEKSLNISHDLHDPYFFSPINNIFPGLSWWRAAASFIYCLVFPLQGLEEVELEPPQLSQ